MSDDIADQILAEIKESKFGFAIQLDKSTDITNYCQLLVYVRYAQTNIVKTELLLNHEVSTTTKGKDIFNILDSFFKKSGLDWKNLVGCTTDGAPSMLGSRSGFQSYVKAFSPNVTSVRCFIHKFALCTKVLHAQLLACLKQVVKIKNFVKASALNIRYFKQLCEDLGSEHTSLLYHTKVRWLSRGNATKRLFEMKNEMLLLFKKLGHPYSKDLENDKFVQRLAYLSDIFEAFRKSVASRTKWDNRRFCFKARCFHSKIRFVEKEHRKQSTFSVTFEVVRPRLVNALQSYSQI